MLRRSDVTYADLPNRDDSLQQDLIQQVEIEIKYAGYIDRQELEIEKFKSLEGKRIPESFDYSAIPSLRTEAKVKLSKIRPATLGQAARISGVSPADISIVMVWLKRGVAADEGVESLNLKTTNGHQ
jgi:tRNA uridine 5-carboxymethylaminomethyl modification enzyme